MDKPGREMTPEELAVAQAQGQPQQVAGAIQILLVPNGGRLDLRVNSVGLDPVAALGWLELAKDVLKKQLSQPQPSRIAVASGNVPRV